MAINLVDFLLTVQVFPQDANIQTREVGEKKRVMRTQSAYFKKPSRQFPEYFKFSLPDDQLAAYPPDHYLLHPDSFAGGDYDSLELNRFGIKLVPMPPEIRQLLGLK